MSADKKRKKKYNPRPVRGVFAPRMPSKQCAELSLTYHAALFRLRRGMGDEKDLWTLSAMMEMVAIGLERSRLDAVSIAEGLATLQAAFAGLMRSVWRGHDGKSWGLDGETLQVMRDVVVEHDVQVATAAHSEIEVWVKEAYRRASGRGVFAIDCDGLAHNVADLGNGVELVQGAA